MYKTNLKSGVITDDAVHDAGGRSRLPWPEDSVVEPVFSSCLKYRYRLSEVWDTNKPLVMWVLMNPSVACIDYRDPTLQKTGKFSRSWGYGGQLVANVHAYRATDKNRLLEVDNPVGPDNDETIRQMAQQAETIVLAFGKPPRRLRGRGQDVIKLLEDHSNVCYLRMAKDGVTPCHPLYLPDDTVPVRYVRPG